MKKSIGTILFLASLINVVNSQIIDIPDQHFKDKLINHDPVIDINGDNEIQYSEAEAFLGTLDLSGSSSIPGEIHDLTGIEAFINIDALNCEYNQIETLSLTNNSSLHTLICNYNGITELDISNNLALRTLSASGNWFESIDLSNNPNLEFFQCNFGILNSLNTSQNNLLRFLYVQGNSLTALDLSNNLLLTGLIIDNNKIDVLNISANNDLNFVYCRNNQLSELDLSNHIELTTLDCKNNSQLEYINLKNGTNENLILTGGNQSCNFEELPNLNTVCLDVINSPLADFILDQGGHNVVFIEHCLLGLEDMRQDRITIFPNPFNNYVNILSNKNVIGVDIYNLIGQAIYNIRSQYDIKKLYLSDLFSGIYIIKITDETYHQSIRKIIKK